MYYIKSAILLSRSKTNLEWKTPNSGSQLGQLSQHTPDMIPESDSHWPHSATSDKQSSHPGDFSDGGGIGGGETHSGSASRKHSKNEGLQQPMDEAQIVQIATDAFVKELGLENDSLLKDGKIHIREVPAGTYLMKEESHKVCVFHLKLRCLCRSTVLACELIVFMNGSVFMNYS